MDTLYQRIGGDAALRQIVDAMYDRVSSDDALRPFFDGVDMARQRAKFRAFLDTATGGPTKRSGIELRVAHSKAVDSGLGRAHFEAFVRHLRDALAKAGIGELLIDEVMARIERVEGDVLGA